VASDSFDDRRNDVADLANTLEQMFESVGGLLYRQPYGTK